MAREKTVGARDFSVILSQIEHGGLLVELSNQQHQLLEDLTEHAKNHSKGKGVLTLALNFEVDSVGKVFIRSSVKTKAPQRTAEATVFWTDKNGDLCNRDPRQQTLEFKEVGADARAREAAAEGGVGITRAV